MHDVDRPMRRLEIAARLEELRRRQAEQLRAEAESTSDLNSPGGPGAPEARQDAAPPPQSGQDPAEGTPVAAVGGDQVDSGSDLVTTQRDDDGSDVEEDEGTSAASTIADLLRNGVSDLLR